MDPSENPAPAPSVSPAVTDDLQDQVERLRQVLHSLLVLVIVVSGTMTIYLLRQVRYSHAELQALRPQATNIIGQYQKTVGPATDEFLRKLAVYASKHPDFSPVATKYGLEKALTNAAAAATPKAAAPAKK